MRKSESRRISEIIDEYNDYDKEIYLKELGASVHNYIRTGVKNRQLDELLELEEVFQEKYEESFDIKEIANIISMSSKNKIGEISKTYRKEIKNEMSKEKIFEFNIEKASDHIMEMVIEVVHDKLQKILKDAAYLSHMNMLYELYEKEERLRREEAEYEKISEKFQKMADITKSLSREKRMKIEELQKQVNISEQELGGVLSQNKKYFNIREKQESIQVSLSPKGRKYCDYVMDSQEKYSKSTLNQLVYKNCDKLMESLENSYDKGIEFELRFEAVSPEKNRALQAKYHKIMKKIISENEEIYTTKCYIINEEKESVYGDNEKNRIRIPRKWD